MNLLKIGMLRFLLSSKWFPQIFQVATMIAFVLLIVGGISVSASDAGFAKVLRNTNLANLIVWSYWWPLIIVSAVFLGRVWCTVCPMELLNALTVRVGLKKRVPKWLKSGWGITIFYALVLLVGIHTLAIHRIPQRMAIYLLALLALAFVMSLIYEKRAFCSYLCPVGHLLGLYAMVSPFEWRADDLSTCKACKTKDCISKKNRYKITGRSCASNLYPATIKDNRDCLLCTQCLKVCPYNNISFSIRKPFSDFFKDVSLKSSQTAFVLLVSGFVVYEVLSEWQESKAILTWIPGRFSELMGITGSTAGLVSAVIMFIVFPAALLLLIILMARLTSSEKTANTARNFALLLLPTMAGAHVIKAILKTTSRIPYWSFVSSDPAGVHTADKIMAGSLVLDNTAIGAVDPYISLIAAAILVAAFAFIIMIFLKSPGLRNMKAGARYSVFMGALAYWAAFGVTVLLWRF